MAKASMLDIRNDFQAVYFMLVMPIGTIGLYYLMAVSVALTMAEGHMVS